jgi:phage repressor protein C with HTH and peptisase S24 domain
MAPLASLLGMDSAASDRRDTPRTLNIKHAPDQMPTKGAYDDVGSVKLRRLNLELAMGDGTDIEDWIEEQEVSFDANLFHAITSSDTDRVFIGSGIGDSMTPTIGDRDDVLIDLNESELKRGDRIYAITIEGAGAVKRLMPAGNGMVEVISDNPTHAARVRILPREMVKIIGRVVWSGRRH